MHKIKRKELLLSFICKNKFNEINKVLNFTKKYGISSNTTRRDLKELQKESFITLVHGGIFFLGIGEKKCNIDIKYRNLNFEKKMIIAKKANKIIKNNDLIFIGSGSTCELFVSQIKKKVKIVTNSLRIMEFAIQNSNINYLLLFGGKLLEYSKTFYGSFCEESLSLINFDTVIFSTNKIDEKGCIYKKNEEIARVELAALSKVNKKILLADHTKLEKNNIINSFCYFSLKNLTNIITDKPKLFNKFNINDKLF